MRTLARSISQNRYLARRADLWRALLAGLRQFLRCADCGAKGELEFHHRDPKQRKFGINISCHCRSWIAILAELQKCDPLCSRCHKRRHKALRQYV